MPAIGVPLPSTRLPELLGAKSAATTIEISGRPAWIRPLMSRYRASMLIDPRDRMLPLLALLSAASWLLLRISDDGLPV
jgi:hypothetical protein